MVQYLSRVRRAVILAAGNGDRFRNGSAHSKLLSPVAGTPLLIRTLESASAAGITDAHIVLGYDAGSVRALAEARAPSTLRLYFHLNSNWHEENGVSVLTARAGVDHQPFALMMGDHIVDSDALAKLLREPVNGGETLLCVDRDTTDPDTVIEATRVRMDGERVKAIGKMLDPYDALDTGLFVCTTPVFDALEASCAAGDSTLSGGIRRLAAEGRVRGVDIGGGRWCDIDTVDDLNAAERLVSAVPAARV